MKEAFKLLAILIGGLLSFVLMLIIIDWVSLLQRDTLTSIFEYTLPVVAIIYIHKLHKLKK